MLVYFIVVSAQLFYSPHSFSKNLINSPLWLFQFYAIALTSLLKSQIYISVCCIQLTRCGASLLKVSGELKKLCTKFLCQYGLEIKNTSFRIRCIWIWIPVSLLISCVTLIRLISSLLFFMCKMVLKIVLTTHMVVICTFYIYSWEYANSSIHISYYYYQQHYHLFSPPGLTAQSSLMHCLFKKKIHSQGL